MANTLTITDVHVLVNSLVSEAMGSNSGLTVQDTSSLVSVGDTLLRTGKDNLFSAMSQVWGRTIFAVREYKGRFRSIRVDDDTWGSQIRKISYLSKQSESSTDFNTDINPTQLDDGKTIDMYKINKPKPVEFIFSGMKTKQFHITRTLNNMFEAFRDESEFMNFWDGSMLQFYNDIEQSNEVERQAVVLNFIAGKYYTGNHAINLTSAYNNEYGTAYTTNDLLTTQLESFIKYLAVTIKYHSKLMEERSYLYHINPSNVGNIPRHTDKKNQKMLMNVKPFLTAEGMVYPSLFNPKYLEIGDFEEVTYWQNINNPMGIKIKPNVLNATTGVSEDATKEVELTNVIGVLYDKDAMAVNHRFDGAYSTPLNAAGRYWNMYIHELNSFYNDFTENAVIFYMAD